MIIILFFNFDDRTNLRTNLISFIRASAILSTAHTHLHTNIESTRQYRVATERVNKIYTVGQSESILNRQNSTKRGARKRVEGGS